ncbi:MAG: alpha/beta hydrolase-fold protein [Planctomycetaceae bacterium]
MRNCGGRWRMLVLGLLAVCGAGRAPEVEAQVFRLTYSEGIRQAPYTGRVYLFFQQGGRREPRFGPDWFRPGPMVAVDVVGWRAGDPLEIAADRPAGQVAFPKPLAEQSLAGLKVQAVARFNPLVREVGNGAGNGYSAVADLPDPLPADQPVELVLDQLVAERKFTETEWSKLLRVKSQLLGKFHGRDSVVQGAVVLPASYHTAPNRRYPVLFSVSGFGGNHFSGQRAEPVPEKNAEGVEFLRVFLDADCPLGHHVFADSANNGPVGQSLVEEFIPALDAAFRTVAAPTARFVTGHSSGGWSSLWLQVAYPDVFGGCWSTAPDPVDFHDFQQIDMYTPGENMYVDREGNRRPLGRSQGQVLVWYDDFDRMEELLGPGGQLHSFEAVFSPRGGDGKPLRAWNRQTGVVDLKVTEHWKQYDIAHVLESEWATRGPRLKGKLHVIMGDEDTFYLEGATRRLQQALARVESDAVVELVPGKDHGSLLTGELLQRLRREMVAAYLSRHTPDGTPRQESPPSP